MPLRWYFINTNVDIKRLIQQRSVDRKDAKESAKTVISVQIFLPDTNTSSTNTMGLLKAVKVCNTIQNITEDVRQKR